MGCCIITYYLLPITYYLKPYAFHLSPFLTTFATHLLLKQQQNLLKHEPTAISEIHKEEKEQCSKGRTPPGKEKSYEGKKGFF
jgi:hypothetical protein